MNQFQKNVIFVAFTLVCIALVCFGVNFALQAHDRSLQEQARREADRKLAWKKENIRLLKGLSAVGALSADEQTRVDNAGYDLDRLQQVLLDIHQERITYWQSALEDAQQRRKKLNDLSIYTSYAYANQVHEAADSITSDEEKAKGNLVGYLRAQSDIRTWHPSDINTFQASTPTQEATPSSKAKPSASAPEEATTEPGAAVNLTPASISTPSTAEVALDDVDTEVRAALEHWAAAMQTNDPAQEASCYASKVDRYFLRLNVTNDFVRDYMTTSLGSNYRRISKFQPQEITFENESANEVKLRLVKDVIERDGSSETERFTRSRLHLVKEDGSWKISSEQDFK